MKFTKLDLLTLLISLFLFTSCKNSNTIGLDLDPGTQITGTLVDSLTVLTRTVADDPTYTWIAIPTANNLNLTRHPLGYLVDPVLGTTESSLSMGVALPNNTFSFGNTPVLDSAVLVLPYSTQFYGDTTTSVYSVDVHQLSSDITRANSFQSNQEYPFTPAVIGNFTGKIKPTTPLKITNIVTKGIDTLGAVVPQLRIKLNNEFIQSTILGVDTSQLKNNPAFAAYFKGLHVNLNKTTSTGAGGLMFFNMTSTTTARIELYYKRKNATTATNIDTVMTGFPVALGTLNPVAATIKHTYTEDVTTQLADVSSKQYNVTYLQGLAGLRNKVSFPYLKTFYDKFGVKPGSKIIINKAELLVDVSSGTDVAPFTAAPRLALYRYNIAGQRVNLPDNTTSDPRVNTNFGGGYDLTNKRYTFIVTSYLQDLLDGKTEDYGTFLSTSPSTEFSLTPTVTSGSRSVIGSFTNPTNRTKLNIFYTVVN
jgi:hypothetical protein